MQIDPSLSCARVVRPRRGPWGSGSARFALLPIALGLLPAGLLSACTLGVPALTAEAPRVRDTAVRPPGRAPAPSPDPARPVRATLAHAEQGDVDAMVRLALMHETGTAEVAQDRTEMLRWLALASALGSGPASYKLFVHYDDRPNGSAQALRFKALAQQQGYYGPVSTQSSR